MEITGTPSQISFGLSLANIVLAGEIVGQAVRSGRMEVTEAVALFAAARRSLRDIAPLFPGDPEVMQIAEATIGMAEQTALTASAEAPPKGPH